MGRLALVLLLAGCSVAPIEPPREPCLVQRPNITVLKYEDGYWLEPTDYIKWKSYTEFIERCAFR